MKLLEFGSAILLLLASLAFNALGLQEPVHREVTATNGGCSSFAIESFKKEIDIFQANFLLISCTVLLPGIVLVAIFKPRYRHKLLRGQFFLLSMSIYLQMSSTILSMGYGIVSSGKFRYFGYINSHGMTELLAAGCSANTHTHLVLSWTSLCLSALTRLCITLVVDGKGQDQNHPAPALPLMQTAYACYVLGSSIKNHWYVWKHHSFSYAHIGLIIFFLAIVCANIAIPYCSHKMALRSYAHGRNPSFIVQNMKSLQVDNQPTDQPLAPKLIIMGENNQEIEETCNGPRLKQNPNQDGTVNGDSLVTFDKIWQNIDISMENKDLCLAFSLCKQLRCLAAGYDTASAGFDKVHQFFWHNFLQNIDARRTFSLIQDELSFYNDYYNSVLPTTYPESWFRVADISSSMLSIIACIVSMGVHIKLLTTMKISDGQYVCFLNCEESAAHPLIIGILLLDVVAVFVLMATVLIIEVTRIVCHFTSNWRRVEHICQAAAAENNSSQGRFFWNFLKRPEMKINQCSVLVISPTLISRMWHFIPFADSEKIMTLSVQNAVLETLSKGIARNGEKFSPRCLQNFNNLLGTCSDIGMGEIILKWHIATNILELRPLEPSSRSSEDKNTSLYLSRYCAYLVGFRPQLLPDDNTWCETIFNDVRKDSMNVFVNSPRPSTGTSHYQEVMTLLEQNSNNNIIKESLTLCKMLVEMSEDSESTVHEENMWTVVKELWSEIVLHVAHFGHPEDHREAIASGGELITMMWALRLHAGDGASETMTATESNILTTYPSLTGSSQQGLSPHLRQEPGGGEGRSVASPVPSGAPDNQETAAGLPSSSGRMKESEIKEEEESEIKEEEET